MARRSGRRRSSASPGSGSTCLIRWAAHWDPVWYSVPLVTVATVTFPIGFLIGIGAFDYWAYYFSGRPTRPEDHSGHGARRWQDYFRPNTDHKVIGVQYLVTTMTFFVIGGFLAMLFRAELAQPGDQYFNPQTFNVLVSEHAALMIFTVVVPVFAGLGNFVIPLMIGAADMAFPRLNALSFWLLPIGGVIMLARHDHARRRARRPAGRATRRSARTSRSARCSSTWACSGPARARSSRPSTSS